MKNHPLEPLSSVEIKAAAEACKAHADTQDLGKLFFHAITLQARGKILAKVWLRHPSRQGC